MKIEDKNALIAWNSDSKLYLEVVRGKDGQEHLEAVEKGWLGKFMMMLGFGPACMDKVADYIQSQTNLGETFSSQELKKTIRTTDPVFTAIASLVDIKIAHYVTKRTDPRGKQSPTAAKVAAVAQLMKPTYS